VHPAHGDHDVIRGDPMAFGDHGTQSGVSRGGAVAETQIVWTQHVVQMQVRTKAFREIETR
jgi:hypothetical protein